MAKKREQSTDMSVLGKLEDARLKRAMERRREARAMTHLYDAALPHEMKLTGLTRRRRTLEAREAKWKDELSPFVLRLRDLPNPNELVNDDYEPILLNFLVPETLLAPEKAKSLPETIDDLALTEQEIAQQLSEDLLVAPITRARLPKLDIRLPRGRHDAFAPTALTSHLPVSELKPIEAPEHLVATLDLPEVEPVEEEEAEAVLLEEIVEPKVTREKPAREPREFLNWNFKIPSLANHRALAAFIILSFVIVLPLHAMNVIADLSQTRDSVLDASRSGMTALSTGANAALVRDAGEAGRAFKDASASFGSAQESLESLGVSTSLLLSTIPFTDDNLTTGRNLLEAGEALAVAGERITKGLAAMERELDPTPASRVLLLGEHLDSALPYIEEAAELVAEADPDDLPEEERDRLILLQAELPAAVEQFRDFVSLTEIAHEILGGNGTRRYLVMFQNNTEIRATGGFMGSFAELTIRDGEIVDLNVPGGGTYDLRGSLRSYTEAPKALQLLSARWEFQDANWFPDFPTSANTVVDFWKSAGGPSVDGVIAVNATFVADLLTLLGAIDVPAYGKRIDSENFLFETQKIVELEYDKEANTPKAFIGELAGPLLDRALEKTGDEFLTVLERMSHGLNTRDIQLYFTQNALQKDVLARGWAGEMKFADKDYLMIVDTNLGGGKTDGVIEQDANLQVAIADDGSITNTLTLNRTHYGIAGALFSGVNNVDYLRIYVPKGSELIDAEGFSIPDESLFETPEEDWYTADEIAYTEGEGEVDPVTQTLVYEEGGKTVFANWVQTKPGSSSTVRFTYKLPFTIESLEQDTGWFDKLKTFIGVPTTEEYSLIIQKQAGIQDRETHVEISLPERLESIWSTTDLTGATFTNTQDAFLGALFETQSL